MAGQPAANPNFHITDYGGIARGAFAVHQQLERPNGTFASIAIPIYIYTFNVDLIQLLTCKTPYTLTLKPLPIDFGRHARGPRNLPDTLAGLLLLPTASTAHTNTAITPECCPTSYVANVIRLTTSAAYQGYDGQMGKRTHARTFTYPATHIQ